MFAFRGEHSFPNDERLFLVSIASQCGHALERLRMLREAQAANRAKDEFLALLGHELRNPLAPIVTALILMKLRRSGDHEKERQIIERQVDHLTRLVDDLLDVSRVTGGRLRLRFAQLNLTDVIRDAVAAVRPLMEGSGHDLTVDLPELPILLTGDSARLTQVVANLLNNAARYTPPAARSPSFSHVPVTTRSSTSATRAWE
jgi:signal transduction histidine kinase